MTATQKTWAHFKTNFIMAYHKLKKQSKNQFKNIMTGEIMALIANDLHKFSTQFNEDKKKIYKLVEANHTLKYIVEACKKKTTALENTVKALDKKNSQGNYKKYDNKDSNDDNIIPKPPVIYYHSCGCTNDTLNVSMNFTNPKPGHKWHTTFRKSYEGSEVNCAES